MNASRRRLLAATAGVAALSVGAGCSSRVTDEPEEQRDPTAEERGEDGADDEDGSSAGIAADDWPSFQRTPHNDGYSPTAAPTSEPSERWSTTLSGAVGDQVAAVDRTVYAATDAAVHALDAMSGDEIWSESLEGCRSQCPCVVDGQVVVGTDAGRLVALNATDGEREWATDLAGPVAGPTAADGTVYVGTRGEPGAYAVDAAEGDVLWSAELSLDAVDYPAVTNEGVYVGVEEVLDGRLHAFDRFTGSEGWIHEGARMQSPTVIEDDIVAPSLTVEVLSPSGFPHRGFGFAGHVIWSPAATTEAIYAGSTGGRFAVFSRSESGTDWNVSVGNRPNSAPAVTAEAVYLTVGGAELVALDVATGEQLWARPLEDGYARGLTVANGAVFVGTDEGRLVAFE